MPEGDGASARAASFYKRKLDTLPLGRHDEAMPEQIARIADLPHPL